MLRIIDRYIAKQVLLATAIAILVVIGLAFVIDLLSELRDIGEGDYGMYEAILHVILLLPRRLYEFFPMLMLVGGVLGLGILSTHQELILMRASGVSPWRLVAAVMVSAVVLMLLALCIGEGLAPKASFIAEKRKLAALHSGQAVVTGSEVWVHEGNNFLRINRVLDAKHLEGVTRYQFDNQHRLMAVYTIASLDFKQDRWQLHHVAKTVFTKDSASSVELPLTTWDLALNPSLLSIGLVEPRELSLPRLWQYSQHLRENGLHAGVFELEFWKRLIQPLTTLIMILLAVPFALSAPRTMGMSWRILMGVLIGLTFYIASALLAQLSLVLQIPALLAVLLPTLIVAACAIRLMQRQL